LLRREGDKYREYLQKLAKDLGVEANVIFRNRFVSPQEMMEVIGAADIYITPYKHKAQVVSGTLAYALSAGKAIVSTPYLHAIELLDNERGALVPFDDPEALAAKTVELLDNSTARHAMRKRAYLMGREMIWSHVATLYMESFQRARHSRPPPFRSASRARRRRRRSGSRSASAPRAPRLNGSSPSSFKPIAR
jgi:glycosyltransferase involved in cell wall biosynthesis